MKVAVVQFTATRDKADNRDRLTASVTRAAEQGADLIVAPEAAMHPFGRPDEPLQPVVEPLDGPFVGALATAVKGSDATVLAGLRGAYRKIHLSTHSAGGSRSACVAGIRQRCWSCRSPT